MQEDGTKNCWLITDRLFPQLYPEPLAYSHADCKLPYAQEHKFIKPAQVLALGFYKPQFLFFRLQVS